jgi:hypothetical protein
MAAPGSSGFARRSFSRRYAGGDRRAATRVNAQYEHMKQRRATLRRPPSQSWHWWWTGSRQGYLMVALVAVLFSSITVTLIWSGIAITDAVQRGIHQPAQRRWYQTVDWKQVAIVAGAVVVAVLTFLKLLFETIKSALDVRDRLRGTKEKD